MEKESLIRFSDVSYRYESDNETPLPLALKNVDIDIKIAIIIKDFCCLYKYIKK